MAIEILLALEVSDDSIYQQYRDAMTPILVSYGGAFIYDFKVSEVLRSPVEEPINRVFNIRFGSESAMDDFFADEAYQVIRRQYFDTSVTAVTEIAQYDC